MAKKDLVLKDIKRIPLLLCTAGQLAERRTHKNNRIVLICSTTGNGTNTNNFPGASGPTLLRLVLLRSFWQSALNQKQLDQIILFYSKLSESQPNPVFTIMWILAFPFWMMKVPPRARLFSGY